MKTLTIQAYNTRDLIRKMREIANALEKENNLIGGFSPEFHIEGDDQPIPILQMDIDSYIRWAGFCEMDFSVDQKNIIAEEIIELGAATKIQVEKIIKKIVS